MSSDKLLDQYLELRFELDQLDSLTTITFTSEDNWSEIIFNQRRRYIK